MNRQPLIIAAETAMNTWDPDPDHARQVCRLALDIYDQLAPLHDLDKYSAGGVPPRRILETAALMHDIGWSGSGSRGNHKKSHAMIMDMSLPGVSDTDHKKIALVARYHRKRHPDPSRHYFFAEMNPDDQRQVQWLAGILRVADGLDRAHTADVKRIACGIVNDTITLEIQCPSGFAVAVYGANRKKALLEEISGCTVIITP